MTLPRLDSLPEPQELRQPGLPKGIHGTKGTKKAEACHRLPGADFGGPVVRGTG